MLSFTSLLSLACAATTVLAGASSAVNHANSGALYVSVGGVNLMIDSSIPLAVPYSVPSATTPSDAFNAAKNSIYDANADGSFSPIGSTKCLVVSDGVVGLGACTDKTSVLTLSADGRLKTSAGKCVDAFLFAHDDDALCSLGTWTHGYAASILSNAAGTTVDIQNGSLVSSTSASPSTFAIDITGKVFFTPSGNGADLCLSVATVATNSAVSVSACVNGQAAAIPFYYNNGLLQVQTAKGQSALCLDTKDTGFILSACTGSASQIWFFW